MLVFSDPWFFGQAYFSDERARLRDAVARLQAEPKKEEKVEEEAGGGRRRMDKCLSLSYRQLNDVASR